jgi:AraC-like DNA-binding protein
MSAALSAIHDRVNTPWTFESLAEAAGMSRFAFAARFKELLGQTPLEHVTEWRMQKAMQLLQQRDKKLIDVARSVGYESDAAFSKAFKRVVGANPGEYLKRDFEGHGNAGRFLKRRIKDQIKKGFSKSKTDPVKLPTIPKLDQPKTNAA